MIKSKKECLEFLNNSKEVDKLYKKDDLKLFLKNCLPFGDKKKDIAYIALAVYYQSPNILGFLIEQSKEEDSPYKIDLRTELLMLNKGKSQVAVIDTFYNHFKKKNGEDMPLSVLTLFFFSNALDYKNKDNMEAVLKRKEKSPIIGEIIYNYLRGHRDTLKKISVKEDFLNYVVDYVVPVELLNKQISNEIVKKSIDHRDLRILEAELKKEEIISSFKKPKLKI